MTPSAQEPMTAKEWLDMMFKFTGVIYSQFELEKFAELLEQRDALIRAQAVDETLELAAIEVSRFRNYGRAEYAIRALKTGVIHG